MNNYEGYERTKSNIRKYAISASQTIHLDHVNDTFRLQKQIPDNP